MLEAQPTYFLFPFQLKKKQTQFLETKPLLIWRGGEGGMVASSFSKAKQEAGKEVEFMQRLRSVWKSKSLS